MQSTIPGVEIILKILSQYSSARRIDMETPSVASECVKPNASPPCPNAIVKSIQDQMALLASIISDGVLLRSEATCADCEQISKYNDELNIRVDILRRGLMEEKTRHFQTSLDLQQLKHVIDACNVTFQQISQTKDGCQGNGLSLYQVANDAITSYCDEKRKEHLSEEQAAIDRKNREMKTQAQEVQRANKIFHEFAMAFNIQLLRYSDWLDARCQSLKDNHKRYCQIMQEYGGKSELLYDDQEVLSEAEASYKDAWTGRLEAARKATEMAQVYGLSDPFEDMDEV
jgi:hypothetical protein